MKMAGNSSRNRIWGEATRNLALPVQGYSPHYFRKRRCTMNRRHLADGGAAIAGLLLSKERAFRAEQRMRARIPISTIDHGVLDPR